MRIVKYKPDDQVINNQATLQDDEDLFFTVRPGEWWVFELWLIVFTSTSTTPDFKYAIAVPEPTPPIPLYYGSGGEFRRNADETAIVGTVVYTPGTEIVSGISAGVHRPVLIKGYIWNNGSVNWTVKLQWAQNVATPENTRVCQGSHLIAHRVA